MVKFVYGKRSQSFINRNGAGGNQKLILQGVGWDFYERILSEFAGSNALHFAYDDGFLEVEVPLAKHERPNRILQDLVTRFASKKK